MAKPLFQTLFGVQAVSKTRYPAFILNGLRGLAVHSWRVRDDGAAEQQGLRVAAAGARVPVQAEGGVEDLQLRRRRRKRDLVP